MANKADGSVTIQANLNVTKAQKELKKLETDIENTEKALNDKKTKKAALSPRSKVQRSKPTKLESRLRP